MVRRLWVIASLVALLCGALVVSGCVSSDEDEARTPESAETVVNSALQTDEDGSTVAPDGAAPPPAEEEPGDGGEPLEVDGDPAAGETVFASNCTACHLNNGLDGGGFGPQLAGQGLEPDYITEVVTNGLNAMPAGIVSGDELTDVVAYVMSLQ